MTTTTPTKSRSIDGRNDAPVEKRERASLLEAWTSLHGNPPPKGMSTRLLALAVAYEEQVKQHGGLNRRVRKRLADWAPASGGTSAPTIPVGKTKVATGTRLVREWQGKSHVVDVHDGGVTYEGQTFKSLSAVARVITGARWSGPRFFGIGGK